MVQLSKINVHQELLTHVSALYQTNQITESTRNQMVLAIKKSIRTRDFTDFLIVLNKNTKFCDYPEIIEDCKEIIHQFEAKD